MTVSSHTDLQGALFATLSGAIFLNAAEVPVYDYVPHEATNFPYINLGEIEVLPWDTKNKDGQEHLVTIHSWSQYRGYKELKDVMDGVRNLLHHSNITVSRHQVVLIRCDFEQTMLDPDNITRHGVQRFRVLTMEA